MRVPSAFRRAVASTAPRVEFPGPSYQVRRFDGPMARELFLLARPDASLPSFAGQTQSAYAAMARALSDEGGTARHVLRETVLLGDPDVDSDALLAARRKALGEAESSSGPAMTLIGQPSVVPRERILVLAWAAIERKETDVRSVPGTPPCACRDCNQIHARAHDAAGEKQLWSGNIYGSPGPMLDEATEMFDVAEGLLAREGMDFHSVVRTWIYLRDIENDYTNFNRARRAFFKRAGITRYPASTGIQGRPCPGRHRITMSLHAFRPASDDAPHPMTTATLNEAPSYGSYFSRGMRLVEANKVSLHVSGTASVDALGRTAHPGDFDKQANRMLLNISTLLERDGATFGDVLSAVTYLRSAEMAARYFEILEERGLVGFPHALVEARICRPDLLCEMEVQAALRVSDPAASWRDALAASATRGTPRGLRAPQP